MENMIHHIINHNLLLKTNTNVIIMIQEQNKLPLEIIMMRKKWENIEIFIV